MTVTALVRNPRFARIFLAQAVSTLGDNVAPIAIAFAVLATTHSAGALGLVLAARTLPMAVFMLIGGAWADRLPRRSLMVASDLTRLTTQGIFAMALIGDHPSIWLLVALQALNGTATAFFRPASSGLVQESVAKEYRQTANSLLSASSSISSILGPVLAAILVSFAGNAWAVGVDAISFGVSALFLIGVVVPKRDRRERAGIRIEIAQGFAAVASRHWLRLQIILFAEFQFVVLAVYSVLGPVIAEHFYAGASTWALVSAASGLGALAGNVISVRLRPVRPLVAANLFLLACIPLIICLALVPGEPALIAAGFLFGIGLSTPDTFWFTVLQDNVPQDLMARVSSIDWMGSMVLRPLGLALVAPLAALIGAPVVAIGAAALTTSAIFALLASRPVRNIRSTEASATPVVASPESPS